MDDLSFSTVITILGAAGVIISIIYAIRGGKRADTQASTQSARQLARIETTLDSVRGGVDDIRVEMRTQQKQINDHETRITRIEAREEMRGD